MPDDTGLTRPSRRSVLRKIGGGAVTLSMLPGAASADTKQDGTLVFRDEFTYTDSPFNHGWSEDTSNPQNDGCNSVDTDGDILTTNAGSFDHCILYQDVSLGNTAPPRADMRGRSLRSNGGGEGKVTIRIAADNKLTTSTTQFARLTFQKKSPKNILHVQSGDQRAEVTADRLSTADWQTLSLWYNGERTFAGTPSNRFLVADVSPPLSGSVRVFINNGSSVNQHDYYRVYRGRFR